MPPSRHRASLSPEQPQLAQAGTGLPFTRMSLAQQQFLSLLPEQLDPFRSQVDLCAASLQVEYTTPGEFQWTPLEPDASPARRQPESPRVRARTRAAALQAARQVDPPVTYSQISPTEYTLARTYRITFLSLLAANMGAAVRLCPRAVVATGAK